MENNTNTQVEEYVRLAWFNRNNNISIGTMNLNSDSFLDLPDYIELNVITAIELRNQLNIAIKESLETIKELNEIN